MEHVGRSQRNACRDGGGHRSERTDGLVGGRVLRIVLSGFRLGFWRRDRLRRHLWDRWGAAGASGAGRRPGQYRCRKCRARRVARRASRTRRRPPGPASQAARAGFPGRFQVVGGAGGVSCPAAGGVAGKIGVDDNGRATTGGIWCAVSARFEGGPRPGRFGSMWPRPRTNGWHVDAQPWPVAGGNSAASGAQVGPVFEAVEDAIPVAIIDVVEPRSAGLDAGIGAGEEVAVRSRPGCLPLLSSSPLRSTGFSWPSRMPLWLRSLMSRNPAPPVSTRPSAPGRRLPFASRPG